MLGGCWVGAGGGWTVVVSRGGWWLVVVGGGWWWVMVSDGPTNSAQKWTACCWIQAVLRLHTWPSIQFG